MRNTILPTLFGLVVVFTAQNASARPKRVAQIPNGSSYSCGVCHVSASGGGSLTVFGQDARRNLISGNVNWPALAPLDSDGDGFTNGEELGDPDGDGTPIPGFKHTNPTEKASFPECLDSDDCSSDEVCNLGECVPGECLEDGDCDPGFVCRDFLCVDPDTDSDTDTDTDSDTDTDTDSDTDTDTDSDTDTDTDSDTDTDTDSDTDDDEERGCACSSSSPEPLLALPLLIAPLIYRRRKRK